MKKPFLLLTALHLLYTAGAQKIYWQQEVNYTIDVRLHPAEKTLDGFEQISYKNNSPDTLTHIWFHLWPNAYKNDRTAFSDQLLRNDNTRFYFSSNEQRGYINRLDFRVNGALAKTEDHPEHIDIIKLLLPQALPPGGEATITTPFHVKLPFNFSRGGYDGSSFQVTQWYPKPAVYDAKGWHPMPYLDQGEFYSEFGSFDVTITVPWNYTVAATGTLQEGEELEKLKKGFRPTQPPSKAVTKDSGTAAKKALSVTDTVTKALRFTESRVHDFAWFANPRFGVDHDTCRLASGRVINLFSYYTPEHKDLWQNSVSYAKDALRFYSAEVGEYPYSTLSVVQGPPSFGGGMEYPTITIISPLSGAKELDIITAHEIGHNWFYGILGSHEREHPWMDEGLNTFYERKYSAKKYGPPSQEEELLFQTRARQRRDQPINTPAEAFTAENYFLTAYHKTAKWLQLVEERMGTDAFRKSLQQYYRDWAFRHPQPENFFTYLRVALPSAADSLISLQTRQGLLPGQKLSGFTLLTPLQPKSIRSYLNHPTARSLILSPALGLNDYDKWMIGGVITNIKLPPSSFQALFIPMYSTGSKKLTGLGRASYSVYPQKTFQKAEAFLSASTFSNRSFVDERNRRHLSQFYKFVPGFELFLKEKEVHTKRLRSLQWKSFLIGERPFRIFYDSLFTGGDTSVVQQVQRRPLAFAIHQVQFTINNYRALYPYSARFTAQASGQFARLTFEGNYLFNYAGGGGLSVRLFGGKFFYNQGKTYPYGYSIDRFFLSLSGVNGEEDYTYSHYFAGRNEFEGLASRQIAIRDGGFKIRTDLLASKVGLSDNWLAAVNFSTSVPRLPVRLFADIGTFAGAWEPGAATGRFLYDAGLQIPLFGVIDLYFPLLYSQPFTDYVKSNYGRSRFLKTATFTIDLQQLNKNFRKQLLF